MTRNKSSPIGTHDSAFHDIAVSGQHFREACYRENVTQTMFSNIVSHYREHDYFDILLKRKTCVLIFSSCVYFFLIFCFWAVRKIKLAISSAFERTLIYRIVSYRIVLYRINVNFDCVRQLLVLCGVKTVRLCLLILIPSLLWWIQ